MSQSQLPLALADQPKERRESALEAFHNSGDQPIPAEEAKRRDASASRQERLIVELFRTIPLRMTPSEVNKAFPDWPLTSVRRAMTNATSRGLLQHHKRERKPGPFGVGESTWSLNQPTTTSTRGDRT